MNRTRAKSTGRLGTKRGERYALIPEEVFTSAAYGAQPDFAKVVLVAMAARYHGRNNGNLSLIQTDARTLGVEQAWKLYGGLNLLKQCELIQCTRQGRLERGTKLCNLFALTWRGIDPAPDGVWYDAGISPCPLPNHAWAKWEKPENWAAIVRKVKRANQGKELIPVSVTGVIGGSTTGVIGKAETDQPRVLQETTFPAQPVIDTSKILAGGTWGKRMNTKRSPRSASNQAPLSTPIDRARKLIAKLPHLTNADVAKIARVELADVQTAREAHAH